MTRYRPSATDSVLGTRSYTTNFEQKNKAREEVSDQVAEYLAKGGDIQQMKEVSAGAAYYKSLKPHVRINKEGEMRIVRYSPKRYC